MPLNAGDTLLNGQYRILRQLGRGGFGFVYLAQDTLLGEDVAIKELSPALVGNEVVLKRFLTEAKATMRLTHERIVRTHNVFQEAGNFYIAMEYMAGGSLDAWLRERGALPVDESVRFAAEVCQGLYFAHRRGVVHCDLKPANILFAILPEGGAPTSAKVADFGIAHVSDQMVSRTWLTPAGFSAGTLPYMSPEQVDGVRDDPRVDVYAVGAVLYRMLTGQTYLAFDEHETPGAQADNVLRIRQEQPAPPSGFSSRVPGWLDAVVLRALAKSAGDRYATADDLRTALLQAGAMPDTPTQAVVHPPAVPEPAPEPPTRAVQSAPGPQMTRGWLDTGRQLLRERPAWLLAIGALLLLLIGWRAAVALRPPVPTPEPTEAPVAAIADTPTTEAPGPLKSEVTGTSAAVVIITPSTRPTKTATPTLSRTSTVRPSRTASPTATPSPSLTPSWTPSPSPTATAQAVAQTRPQDGMKMVSVPAGEFTMGATSADADADAQEKPPHAVYLDAFWLDGTEVTNTQYTRFLNALGGHRGRCGGQDCIRTRAEDDSSHIQQAGRYAAQSSYGSHPVVMVSWYGARAYCQWAGGRLPTEAEWEKAARGTNRSKYPWGDKFGGGKANTCDRNCPAENKKTGINDGYARTAPVGSFKAGASPYGALDMAGNVWEWTSDWYGEGYYRSSPDRNPQGPSSGGRKVIRGGSWKFVPWYSRTTAREGDTPVEMFPGVGFRCASDESR